MTANVLEHRRAKAFADALEAHQTEQNSGRPDSSPTVFVELIDTVGTLTEVPAPTMDAEVHSVQRAQLIAAFEQAFAAGGVADLPRQRGHRAVRNAVRGRWGRRLAIGGLVAGIAVGSLAGAAAASTGALPGDTLYGMKRGIEGLHLDWAGSDSERGALLLGQASTRLKEAQSLVGRAGPASALSPTTVDQVRRALDDMHAEGTRGRELLRAVYRSSGSLDPMRKLAGFAEGQDNRWADLQRQLPPQLNPVAGQVSRLMSDISEDVAPLHLEPVAGSSSQDTAGTSDGSAQSPDATGAPGRSGTGAGQGSAPQASQPAAAPGHDAGAPANGQSAGAATPGPVGGLVNGLTSGLTGSNPTGDSGGGQKAGATPTASASPSSTPQPGLTVPPLIPGLLPGLGLGLG